LAKKGSFLSTEWEKQISKNPPVVPPWKKSFRRL